MKQLFEFEAEYFTHSMCVRLVKELEAKGIEVEFARSDSTFANTLFMIVNCEDAVAKTIKNRIWELNNGLYCEMVKIDQQRLEAFSED